jgi:hypothetical protein
MSLKLGLKLVNRARPIELKFSQYLIASKLPTPPATFGHEALIPTDGWGMFGNDQVGDCVIAGAYHETMLWNKEAGRDLSATTANALSTYSAMTGYDPDDPSTDQGTDMDTAAKYRRKTGIVDAAGNLHKVGAYLDLDPGNPTELYQAAYLFGAVGIGIQVPGYVMDQFNAGKPWDLENGRHEIEGGHYVPVVAKRDNIEVVTWGRTQAMTERFYEKLGDQAIVYLSEEMLVEGKSLEGFDLATLRSDLAAVTA